MKTSKIIILAVLTASVLVAPLTTGAADKKADKKVKPYPLTTCIVADDKLDKDAYVFNYQGQQIKLCCESCKKDFEKEPAKFLKKLEDAEKKAK